MIVRARDRDDLGARDIADRAGRDDGALALHQTRHRGDGAEGPGIGQLDRFFTRGERRCRENERGASHAGQTLRKLERERHSVALPLH